MPVKIQNKQVKNINDAIRLDEDVVNENEESFDPNLFLIPNAKLEQSKNKKYNTIYPSRVYADTITKIGKYNFKFIAPKRTSDAGGYYSMRSRESIPDDYIRVCFCVKQCDTIIKCKANGVSKETWESIRSKYITIYPYKIKEGYETVEQEIMEYLSDFIHRMIYKTSIITIINIEEESSDEDSTTEEE